MYSIDTSLSKEKQKTLMSQIKVGKTLLKSYCSDCHGIFGKGVENIPNFSVTQLDNYKAKFLSNDKVNHAFAKHISIDELSKILTFLKFKK